MEGFVAKPTCPNCGSTSFQNTDMMPTGSNFLLNFIHCSSCGAVVGVMDFHNIGEQIKDLARALGVKIPE
jgi:ribosomal protein S27AE